MPLEGPHLASISLIADLGATNARFALLRGKGDIECVRVLACADYASIEDAIEAYLGEEPSLVELRQRRPHAAALAIAGPVTGERATLTNRPWSFSIGDLRRRLAVDRLLVVNDFTAIAGAIPYVKAHERSAVGGGSPIAGAPIGVLGPGSGLGMSGLMPTGNRWLALSGGGGHATMAPATARESIVLDHLRRRFDHVSAERVLSGQGLVNLYRTLAEIDGIPAAFHAPAEIADPEIGEREPRCREAVDMFCAMLGTIAGNLALTLGARGGIYVAGGIVPKLGPRFAASKFRERFEDKGRMRPFLASIPTYVITHPCAAFLGLAKLLSEKPTPTPGTNCIISRRT
jgi:glucokinase